MLLNHAQKIYLIKTNVYDDFTKEELMILLKHELNSLRRFNNFMREHQNYLIKLNMKNPNTES